MMGPGEQQERWQERGGLASRSSNEDTEDAQSHLPVRGVHDGARLTNSDSGLHCP